MKFFLCFFFLALVLVTGCTNPEPQESAPSQLELKAINAFGSFENFKDECTYGPYLAKINPENGACYIEAEKFDCLLDGEFSEYAKRFRAVETCFIAFGVPCDDGEICSNDVVRDCIAKLPTPEKMEERCIERISRPVLCCEILEGAS